VAPSSTHTNKGDYAMKNINELIDTIRTLNEWELIKYWESLGDKFLTSICEEWSQAPKDCRDKVLAAMTREIRHQVGDTVVLTEEYNGKSIIPKGTIGTLTKIKKGTIFNSYDVLIGQDTETIKEQKHTILTSIAGTW
jgi:hypothetical protein